MVYLGVDLGGTNIKVALVDEQGNILAEAERPTALPRPAEEVSVDIGLTIDEALAQKGLTYSDVTALGVGCPGTVDNETGVVRYSNNLHWKDFPLRQSLFEKTGLQAALGNDANVAALGEVVAGIAKGAESAVIITLGTGVGVGVVLDGKILTGYTGAASEMGHAVIVADGYECTCGRKGCLESYASATALIRMTKQAIEKYPDSGMAQMAAKAGRVDGRTSFDAMRAGDSAGKAVVDEYIRYLGIGLTNVANTFYPQVIALSGGISKEGETLLQPLRTIVYRDVFGGMSTSQKHTRIEACILGHRAGLIGAAMLAKQQVKA